jgi:hypothetical protein
MTFRYWSIHQIPRHRIPSPYSAYMQALRGRYPVEEGYPAMPFSRAGLLPALIALLGIVGQLSMCLRT